MTFYGHMFICPDEWAEAAGYYGSFGRLEADLLCYVAFAGDVYLKFAVYEIEMLKYIKTFIYLFISY